MSGERRIKLYAQGDYAKTGPYVEVEEASPAFLPWLSLEKRVQALDLLRRHGILTESDIKRIMVKP